MRTAITGDHRVIAIIKKKLDPDKRYRLFGFTCSFSEGHICLLRNTMTGMVVALSGSEKSLIEAVQNQPVSGIELKDTGLEDLAKYCFLVEETADDYEQYKLAVMVLRTMSREGKGTKTFTILPTTGCNARCTYCYEEGMPVYSMSMETADRVADFIQETRWQDKIKLIWFGGEPLAGSRIISRICGRLKEKGIPFRSKIITNGTMMMPELLDEAVSLWQLESAQVSVDGDREDYETRKQYIDPSEHNYDAMMSAVGLMLEKGIKVTLRCNYDSANQERLASFFDDVKARFGSPENLSVYPAILFQAHSEENCIDLYHKKQSLNAHLRGLGLKEDKTEKASKLKLNLCGADSGDKSVVIAPDGRLYHCEHLPGNKSFGSIFDPHPTICSDERAEHPPAEQCRNCCFLPICTPFFRNGCPDWFEHCRESRQIEADDSFRKLIQEGNTSSPLF